MMMGGIGVNTLVNHTFEIHNRYPDDRLTRPYVPAVIDGLTGFDLGLRIERSRATSRSRW